MHAALCHRLGSDPFFLNDEVATSKMAATLKLKKYFDFFALTCQKRRGASGHLIFSDLIK